MPSNSSSSDWHLFAWRGLQLDVPRDWELNYIQGGDEKGELRLDDGEMARLELDWARGAGDESVAQVTDRFLKAIQKKRPGEDLDVRRGIFQVTLSDADAETFSWSGGVDVIGMVARCRQCRRVSLVRLIGKRGEGLKATAARAFASFRDHAHGNRIPWSVLNFRFDVPDGYRMTRHSLQAGRMEFDFQFKKSMAQALRLSLAQTLLRKQTLLEWFANDAFGKFGRNKVEAREAPHREHAGLTADGRERSNFLRPFYAPRIIRCRAWHCPESNAVFAAKWIGPLAAEPEFDLFFNSFLCH